MTITHTRHCQRHDLTYVGRECPECKKARMKSWRARNRAHVAAYNHDHYQGQREWKRQHPERTKKHNQCHYKKQGGAAQRKYEARNRSAQANRRRQWKRKNYLKVREYARRRYAWKSASDQQVNYSAILARYGWKCHICGYGIVRKRDLHFDHIIPLSRGGLHITSNVLPAHAHCNLSKSNRIGGILMAVTIVRYERLYNLGNYENEKLCVEVTVEGTGEGAVAEAWAGACQAVEDQHVALETARAEARQRERDEYERKRQEAAQKAAATTRRHAASDDLDF